MNTEPDEAEVEEWIASIDLNPYEYGGMLWYDALIPRPAWMDPDPDDPDGVKHTQVDTNLGYQRYLGIIKFGEMLDQHLRWGLDISGGGITRAQLEDHVRRAVVESMIAQHG